MRNYFGWLALCFLVLSTGAWGQNEATKTLSPRLDTLLKYQLPAGSNVGICVYDLTAGKPLYSYQADKLSRPASTMKLLTTITALARPEADEPFRTEVWYKGIIRQDTLQGDLYVVGGFDPEFTEESLNLLIDEIKRLPFSVINGNVYGDVSMKDSLYWGNGWIWDDNPEGYQPYLSPLMLNKGVVTITSSPGVKGDAARLQCTPASSYYKVRNETRSNTPSAGKFRASRDWLTNGNNLIITGNVNGRRTDAVNVYSSEDFFMHTFVERLQAKGISISPTSKTSNGNSDYAFNTFQKDSRSVQVALFKTRVQDIVNQIMKESDNLNAQALLCRLGAQFTGKKRISDEDGLDAIRKKIKELGYNPEDYKLADGCGLSHYDYISPELLVAFLKYGYSRTDIFQKLYKALPIGGVDGTLKGRMKSGTLSYKNVHAKTGSYTAVNCLAGYLKAGNGHEIAFAIMNQNVLSGAKARNFQDAVCNELSK